MENNEYLFSFSDIKKVIFKKKIVYLIVFVLSFLISFLFFLSHEEEYESEAIFYEDLEKSKTVSNLKDIVFSDNNNFSATAFSYFKTKKIIKKVIEKLALQATIVNDDNLFQKKLKIVKENLNFIFASKRYDKSQIIFTNLFYNDIETKYFLIKFLNNKSYEILDLDNKLIQIAKINEQVKFSNLSFEINEIPNFFINKTFKIQVVPWEPLASSIIKKLKIIKEKEDSHFLFLKIKTPSPKLSSDILNALMDLYSSYQQTENEKLFKNQLSYLLNRKSKLQKELNDLIEEHNNFLKENVISSGLINFDSEINLLIQEKQRIKENETLIENKLYFLKKLNLNDIENISIKDNNFSICQDKIVKLKKEKNLLQKSIDDDFLQKNDENGFKEIAFNEDLKFDIKKQDVISIDENIAFLELKKLDELYDRYLLQKETIQLEISQINEALDKLKFDQYRFSYSSILSFDQIKNILDISKKLNNLPLYTSKEIEILKEEYELEKKSILSYLENILNSKKNDLNFISEKISTLKNSKKDLIDLEISFLTKKAKDLISKNISDLENEKIALEGNLNENNLNIQKLLSKLGFEKELKLKIEMTKNRYENIESLLESKKLEKSLKFNSSKPIDYATSNIFSNSRVLFKSLLVSLALTFIFFIFSIYFSFLNGFSVSRDLIKDLSFEFFGKLTSKCTGLEVKDIYPNDLETLRNIIASIDSNEKIITAICNRGPNFIHYLAALLTLVQKNVLVIETRSEIDDKDGLYTFLEDINSKIPIKKMQAYDYICSGEKKYFSFELMKSLNFSKFISEIKDKYDLIMIYSDAMLSSAEARIFIEFSDKIILAIKDEKIDEIQKFINWAEEKNKLGFITY
jgi:uncharacterized protein involved in exopolysaccharide biosynthesis